jgi:hypothetical protein
VAASSDYAPGFRPLRGLSRGVAGVPLQGHVDQRDGLFRLACFQGCGGVGAPLMLFNAFCNASTVTAPEPEFLTSMFWS